MSGKREFGDYQTPIDFAKKVCDYLRFEKHIQPSTILEPTCGIGNFLESSFSLNANKYYGIEINSEYCKYCEERFINKNVTIINSDVFTFNLKTLINNETNLLVIGNPPWVTNSTLSLLESKNTPKKKNLKRLKGIEAITGASNFDICEYIILQLINEFCNTDTIIAILCKMSVARNVFKELKFNKINFEYCEILEFDATKVFGISISACILLIKLSSKDFCADICNVYSFENFKSIMYSLSYVNGQLFNNFALKNNNFNGICCFEWHQGIKHDCSKIMELSEINGRLYNGKKEIVEIEADILFPLVKSSMFKKPIINTFSKYVLVTQKKIREETAYIEKIAPKTWEYLTNNIEVFNKRKSCIYYNAPQFSMFGIGDYSYSQFKVGLSGFYKKPFFSLLYSSKNKPVMTDDTSYFICFDNYEMAYAAMLILNSKPVQEFLMNIAFLDAKRPYTKKVLKCLSFEKILTVVSYEELQKTEQMLNLRLYITRQMYSNFKNLVEHKKI